LADGVSADKGALIVDLLRIGESAEFNSLPFKYTNRPDTF